MSHTPANRKIEGEEETELQDDVDNECCVCTETLLPLDGGKKRTHLSCGHDTICGACTAALDACPLCRDLLFVTVHIKSADGKLEWCEMQWGLQETQEEVAERLYKLHPKGVVPHWEYSHWICGGRALTPDATPAGRGIVDGAIVHILPAVRGD